MKTEKYQVTGMSCAACSAHVEKAVNALPYVQQATVNLLANSMVVTYDDSAMDSGDIIRAVEQGGYGAALMQKGKAQQKEQARPADATAQELAGMRRRLVISFVFLALLMYVSMGSMVGLPLPGFLQGDGGLIPFAMAQLVLVLPIMYVNDKYYKVGFRALWHRAPNMDTLIALGSAAAFVYSVYAIFRMGWALGVGDMALAHSYHMDLYFESAGMILTLITVGKYMETFSKGKTSDAIGRLLDLAPKMATVERDGKEVEIPVEEVNVGDVLIVRQGHAVPVDGEVIDGSGAVDESAITGESMPVEKGPGSRVIGATISRGGYFKMRATKVGDDTTLAQIVQLVEDAAGSKAPIAKLADKVSGVFVPVVITIAVLATVVWLLLGYPFHFALSIGIAVLVVSCPCALGLATPTAIMVGTGKGAQNGILFKSAESLETLHTVQTVVLDKTGTITQGKPQVTDILPTDGVTETELLTLAAALERQSEHPLATAIVAHAEERGIQANAPQDFAAQAGQGVTAQLNGTCLLGGNVKMMQANGIALGDLESKTQQLAEQGKTPLFFAAGERLLGVIAVADVVKPTSGQAIAELEKMGIEVVMLTGDNERTAKAIQQQLGISRVVAEVLPQDKEAQVRAIQENGRKVAMVGDGINDAPALARSDVGIAIGAGTDVAIESADVVLMKSDLLDAVGAIQLSRAVIRNIKENLFWAFFYNAIGIPLAAGVFYLAWGWKLNPMFGAAAMSLSSFCVVSNALRLKLFRPSYAKQASNTETCPDGSCPIAQMQNAQQPSGEENKEMLIQEQSEKGSVEPMTKTITIDGMMCTHCTGRVEKALNALEGVQAVVSLENKNAVCTITGDVSDDTLRQTVTDAGYDVVDIQ